LPGVDEVDEGVRVGVGVGDYFFGCGGVERGKRNRALTKSGDPIYAWK
jgi:hypothetical protein